MKILIMGAGAVGCAFGGFLKKSGHAVTLVGRGSHFNAIESQGLTISGIWGEHTIHGFTCTTSTTTLPRDFDAILLCVKSFDTVKAAEAIKPLLSKETLVVSLQNGLGNIETLRDILQSDLILGGRVIFGITRPELAAIRITVYTEPVMIGYPQAWRPRIYTRQAERAQQLADIIEAAGIPCRYTEEIEKFQWAKFLYNCALNPLSALHKVPYGALPENREWRQTMDTVIREIFATAQARGIPLFWKKAEEFMTLFYSKLVPDTARHRSSMLQDIEAGRKTEIDSLSGMAVRYAAEAGLQVPENRRLAEAIKTLESNRQ